MYSTYLSPDSRERPWNVAVDSQGAAHIAGVSIDANYPLTGDAHDTSLAGSSDAFYTVLSSDGSRQLYSSFHGGDDDVDPVGEVQSSFDFGDVLVERNCKATFVGRSASGDFPLRDAFQAAMGGGDWDAYVARVDPFTPDGDPHIGCDAVVLATGTPVIRMLAPRSIGTVFGSDFSARNNFMPQVDSNGLVTNILEDTCVEVADERGAAFAVLANQFNFMVPPNTPLGYQPVRVIEGCGTSNETRSEPQYVQIKRVVPAFFNFINNADGVNPIAAVDNMTGALIGPPALFGQPGGVGQGVVTTPAQPGQIISAFATGFGPTNQPLANGQIPAGSFPVASASSLTIGGVDIAPADVFYVGAAPCCAGLDQVTFRVPEDLAAGNHELILTVDGVPTPSGPFIAVEP